MADFRIINHNGVNGNELLSLKIPSGITKINSITVNEFLKLVKRPKTVDALAGLVIKKANTVIGTQPNLNFIEGTNVTLDIVNNTGTQSVDVTVNATGGSGSQVDSVTGIPGEIEVDNIDPVNPIVGLAQAARDSLALADTSLQPGDEFSGDYNDLTNKPDLSGLVKADGSVDFTAPQVGVEGTDPNHLVTVSQLIPGEKGDKGDKGDTGDVGPQGEQGIQGPIGEVGPTGLQGEIGPQGPIGLTGEKRRQR